MKKLIRKFANLELVDGAFDDDGADHSGSAGSGLPARSPNLARYYSR
jgi:hypothetical protein